MINPAEEQPKRDIQEESTENIEIAEIRKRDKESQVQVTGSGNSAAQLLKGLLFWNKESYLLIDNAKHIHLFHAGGTSKMSYVDGVINQESQTSITEKTPKHYIDSPDCKVGSNASHPDTKCDGLMQLLTKMAAAIDAKYGVPSTCSAQVSAAYNSICSGIVKIAD